MRSLADNQIQSDIHIFYIVYHVQSLKAQMDQNTAQTEFQFTESAYNKVHSLYIHIHMYICMSTLLI